MRNRPMLLAGIAACAISLAAPAAASAVTVTYTTPGLTTVTLPPGVTSVHVVAVGGRGGGVQGGYGSVVTADLSNVTPSGPANQIRVFVAGNGSIGGAGANGGGATPSPSLAGGGGGWSGVSPCVTMGSGSCSVFERDLVAGGGGGAGADGLPDIGGGTGGSSGGDGGAGSATSALAAAGGGGSGGSGGSGGTSADPSCGTGENGGDPTTGLGTTGGTGGASDSLDGHGDGGGGGGGSPTGSGGGGGAGAWCADDTGASGAGGGGGDSLVPTGGQLALDTTGAPSVTLTYTPEQPSVAITAPADGAVYTQGSAVTASYACTASSPDFPIASCDGPVATGAAIDTSTVSQHTFAVTATDAVGATAGMTVQYQVTAPPPPTGTTPTTPPTSTTPTAPPVSTALTPPRINGLRIAPRSINAKKHGAHATVRFKLSERASVRVTIVPLRHKKGHAPRSITETVAGHAGSNSFTLRAHIGTRVLAAGSYTLTLVATDPSGSRSRAVKERFKVVA